ncbi:hypothetical protein, partial [Bacteroides thetaiotaomicron]|uniref:hypothetical protein n=1 Tax=Bacteroides thetaiotaomicron TaxID=818 RepID=UPI001C3FF985
KEAEGIGGVALSRKSLEKATDFSSLVKSTFPLLSITPRERGCIYFKARFTKLEEKVRVIRIYCINFALNLEIF